MCAKWHVNEGFVKKRVLTLLLSLIFCLGGMVTSVGCNADRKFTVTFYPNKEMAMLSEEFVDLDVYDEIKYLDAEQIYVEYVKQTVTSAKELVLPVFISNDGYHDGWDKILSHINSSTKLNAQWSSREFIVTFTSGARDAVLVSTETPLSQTVNSPLKLIFPVWTREGYSMHWEKTDTINDNCTISPVWTPNEYQISFVDDDGVTPLCQPKTVTYGIPIGELPMPTKDGKEFGAWRLVDRHLFIYEDKVYNFTENLVLQALWCGINSGLIEYKNVGEFDGEISFELGQEFTLEKPSKQGYTFLGWTGDGIVGDQPVLEYTIPADCTERAFTFTAHWQANEYMVHFDGGESSTLATPSKKVTFGQAIGELPQPTKEGYVFDVWTLNGVEIDCDYIWDVPDNSAILLAKYKRVYTIRFLLSYYDRQYRSTFYCEFERPSQAENLGMVQIDDYVWELPGVVEGTIMIEIPKAKAIGEATFSSWKFGKTENTRGKTVKPGTIINETNFANTYGSGIITLTFHCMPHWSPPIEI